MDSQVQTDKPRALPGHLSTGQLIKDENRPDQSMDWLNGETVTVVIPALNEADNLPHVLPRIPAWVTEVILVDDHCTDNTVEVAQKLMPSIRVVRNDGRPGKGNALQAGYAAAMGSFIVQVDADGSEAPEEIASFVAALLAGADYAKGTRFIPGGGTSDMTRLRKWGNFAFVAMVRCLYGIRYTDLCYGYNAFRADALRRLNLDADGFEIEAMINLRAAQAGLAIREVASFEAERVHGEGRLQTFPDGWRVLKTIWRERWHHRKLDPSQ